MKVYAKKIDTRSRKAMTEYLSKHFRYNTMNSWSQSTSYANNVKVYNLGLTGEPEDKLYQMLELSEFYERLNILLEEFARKHNYLWQVGFNGRRGGYIVLYQGYVKPSQYKSYCTSCGQRNYKSVSETGQSRCGRCGDDARVDYIKPPLEIGTYPGKSTDMYEDFEDWEMYQLRERVRLVCEFDELCDAILATVVDLVDNYEIDEEVVMRPHTVKFLREVAS